ncbi:MAG: metal ABC transporter solute-binding protein, Zn/Mn family [Phycisphaerales bacterium]
MCDRSYLGAMAAAVMMAMLGLASGAWAQPAKPLKVVATTGMVADAAREIGRARVKVTVLMGEGVDPHLYKASPRDVRAMADADLVLYNGLHLEGRMADAIEKMSKRKAAVAVAEAIEAAKLRQPAEFEGHFDPHVWFDVSLWSLAAARTRDALIERDAAGKAEYERAATDYLATLGELDAAARETLATIPKEQRVMVTAHDAFGYFGRAYGLEVLAIQGISTDSEASLRDINALVDTLVSRRVPAVFVESSVPRKTIDALVEGCKGRGHSVTVGGELYSDAMGKDGTLEGTYLGMVLHNVDTIARALGGTVPARRGGRLGEYVEKHAARKP